VDGKDFHRANILALISWVSRTRRDEVESHLVIRERADPASNPGQQVILDERMRHLENELLRADTGF
jgi:hypothetical protein